MSAAGASDDPEANGAVMSFSPSTVTEPGGVAKRSTNALTTRAGSSGGLVPASMISWLITWAPDADDAEPDVATRLGEGTEGRGRRRSRRSRPSHPGKRASPHRW